MIGDAELATHLRGKVHASRARAEVVATLPLGPAQTPDAFHGHLGLLALVLEHDIDRVILAPTAADNRQTLELIRVAKAVGVRVSLLPRMFEVVGSSVDFEDIDGVTMLGLRRFGLSTSARSVKRAFDVAGRIPGAARAHAGDGGRRARGPARLAGPDLLPPAARRPRRPPLPDAQVPHDGRGRRAAQGGARASQRDRAASSRSPTTRGSRASAGCCARPRWTSSRSSSTSCGAR